MSGTAPDAYAPIHELSQHIRSGAVSARGVVECCLDRIARLDGKLHAFVAVYADEARAAAETADRDMRSGNIKGVLHGVPIALKDLVEVEGQVTTGGSLMWRERVSKVTATIAQRLRSAGAIVIGKTHMVELAFGAWGTNKPMGTPWNPWDLETHRVPGGSSSGSGVAVAAGLAPAAIGSDTGGSVRIPAALCGIVGLKTTIGRLSNYGTLRLSDALDTIGPMTRDVEDAALLFDAVHGPDAKDSSTSAHARVDVLTNLKAGVRDMRFAVLPERELGEIDAQVASAFAAALDVMRELGARIDTLTLPVAYERIAVLTGKIIAAEGYRLNREWIDRDDLPFDPDVRDRIRWGKTLSADDYRTLMSERERIKTEVHRSLGEFDALLMPTTPLPAIPVNEVDQNQSPMSRLTRPVNYLDLCALAIPCGFTRAGLPISLQIVGRPHDEAHILRIGRAYENATPWHTRHPKL